MKHVCRCSSQSRDKPESNSIFFFFVAFLGERRKVLNWLLSYNPLWLRIGLEVFWYNNVSFYFLTLVFPNSTVSFFAIHAVLAKHNVAHSQTIYGKLISLESNNDALGLAMFILQRLLWNPDIAAEFRHAKVPHLYKDGNLSAPVIVLSEELQKKSGIFWGGVFPWELLVVYLNPK